MPNGDEPSDNVLRFREMGLKSGETRKAKAEAAGERGEDYKTRWNQLLDGDITVADLDEEELKSYRTRDRLGGFTGRPPKAIPAKLAREMRAEWLARSQAALETALPTAVAALAEIAANTKVPVKDRLAAANAVIERGLGKVPDKVELTQHSADPWEDILQGVLTEDKIERLKEVVDGQVS